MNHDKQARGFSRRQWLKTSGATLASALGTTGLSSLMFAPGEAQASDYKALVCVFLYGGNDGLNTVTPTDMTRYNQYAAVRGALALPQSSLVGLAGSDYGLHPAMKPLAAAWSDKTLAPVFNVGPLWRPTTKAEYQAATTGSPLIPDSLFSHSDQQVLWQASSTSAFWRTGWGGRAAQYMGTTNPVISVGGNARFGISTQRSPLVVPGTPGSNFALEGLNPGMSRKSALDNIYAEAQSNAMLEAYASQHRTAVATSDRLGALLKTQPGDANASAALNQAFAPLISQGKISAGIGAQLYQIAKMIEGNATVQGNRQIFFAELSGFDTHCNQIGTSVTSGTHADLLGQLAKAMAAFNEAMKAIGMSQQVTLFTQSDFGRTVAVNNSRGTDHAWGNHHLVMGGAVRGGTTYGRYPELALTGPDDVGDGHGRWIPTLGVDQYAATLLSWFGATDWHMGGILPNLKNFSQRSIGFLG